MKNIEDAALTARKSLKDVFNVNLVYPISPKLNCFAIRYCFEKGC